VSTPQVVDPVTGWMFRAYKTPTWDFVSATFLPKFLLSSASMSEASLCRVASKCMNIDWNKPPTVGDNSLCFPQFLTCPEGQIAILQVESDSTILQVESDSTITNESVVEFFW
jgi:hypothetical protein